MEEPWAYTVPKFAGIRLSPHWVSESFPHCIDMRYERGRDVWLPEKGHQVGSFDTIRRSNTISRFSGRRTLSGQRLSRRVAIRRLNLE